MSLPLSHPAVVTRLKSASWAEVAYQQHVGLVMTPPGCASGQPKTGAAQLLMVTEMGASTASIIRSVFGMDRNRVRSVG